MNSALFEQYGVGEREKKEERVGLKSNTCRKSLVVTKFDLTV